MHFENQNQGHAERLQTRRRIDLRDMQLHIHDIRVTCEALEQMQMTKVSIETSPKWQEALKQRQARQARKQKGLRSRRKK